MVTLAQLHDPDSDPVLAQVVKMARARRDGLIPGLPKVIGVGDSLKHSTVYYDDGSIFQNGVEVEQTRSQRRLSVVPTCDGGNYFSRVVVLRASTLGVALLRGRPGLRCFSSGFSLTRSNSSNTSRRPSRRPCS